MKDRNNLLTSLIVALLAGGVYYISGADSIDKILPEITYVDTKGGIEIVYSKVEKPEQEESTEKVQWTPRKKQVQKRVIETPEVMDEEREIAETTNIPPMEFDELMALLENSVTEPVKLSDDDSEDIPEWVEGNEHLEKPAIAWAEDEKPEGLKIRTRTPIVYSKAKAAIFINEVKLKKNSKDKYLKDNKKSSADKDANVDDEVVVLAPGKTFKAPSVNVNGNSEVVVVPDVPGYNVIWDAKDIKNNVKVEVKTSSDGYNFIMIQSDDECKSSCKKKCNK